ncbi:hypothetical protein JCM3765_000371 [Sporobolomyces pararoseus]
MIEHEQLESRVGSIEPGIKLFVAIASKVSTLHALAGRYTQNLTIDDLSPPPSTPSTPNPATADDEPSSSSNHDTVSAQHVLDAEQARVKSLMKETIAEATEWLLRVCSHFEVDLATLPESPDSSMRLPDALEPVQGEEKLSEAESKKRRDRAEFEVVWELCLVSLRLVGTGKQAGEPVAKDLSNKKSIGSKVGGLFSSTSNNDNKSSSESSTPPPLNYTALSRSLLVCAAEILGIPEKTVLDVERSIAQFLYFQLEAHIGEQKVTEASTGDWDEAAQDYRSKQEKKGNAMRWAATGAGFILGGVAIGLTGGLAAPALAPVLAGTFGIAAFSGAGGAVLIGTLLAGYRTHRRMKGLENVSFSPLKDDDSKELPQIPSLTATIVASGFLLDLADSEQPWLSTYRNEQVDAYALKADPQTFLEGGKALEGFIKNKLITMGGTEIIKRTALAAVYAGVALPLTIFNTTSLALDSDFTRCKDKAKKAGVLLAEILEKEVQGKRPAVLVGYGPGASLIFSCLQELHRRKLGHLVYSATLISLPEAPSAVAWASARSVVAHEVINVYSKNDWVLAIAARLFTLSNKIAGLGPITVEGITNVDVSDVLQGHLEIRSQLPTILERVKKRNDLSARLSSEAKADTDELEGTEQELQEMTTVEMRGEAGKGDFELSSHRSIDKET